MTRRRALLALVSLGIGIGIFALMIVRAIPERWLTEYPRFENFFGGEAAILGQEEPAARVQRVIDGDTIELASGERVRYIGINAPESVDPRRGTECFGKEASEFNKDLVEGKIVRLEKDSSDRDKYGRLLRFVYPEDGTLANEVLVREGYARVSTYPPDVSKKDILRAAEQEARDNKRGLWSEAICDGKK